MKTLLISVFLCSFGLNFLEASDVCMKFTGPSIVATVLFEHPQTHVSQCFIQAHHDTIKAFTTKNNRNYVNVDLDNARAECNKLGNDVYLPQLIDNETITFFLRNITTKCKGHLNMLGVNVMAYDKTTELISVQWDSRKTEIFNYTKTNIAGVNGSNFGHYGDWDVRDFRNASLFLWNDGTDFYTFEIEQHNEYRSDALQLFCHYIGQPITPSKKPRLRPVLGNRCQLSLA